MNILKGREAEAVAKSAFFSGDTDLHPHGLSGKKWLIPYENDRRMFDAMDMAFSEWGNAAGFDVPVGSIWGRKK